MPWYAQHPIPIALKSMTCHNLLYNNYCATKNICIILCSRNTQTQKKTKKRFFMVPGCTRCLGHRICLISRSSKWLESPKAAESPKLKAVPSFFKTAPAKCLLKGIWNEVKTPETNGSIKRYQINLQKHCSQALKCFCSCVASYTHSYTIKIYQVPREYLLECCYINQNQHHKKNQQIETGCQFDLSHIREDLRSQRDAKWVVTPNHSCGVRLPSNEATMENPSIFNLQHIFELFFDWWRDCSTIVLMSEGLHCAICL